MADYCSASDIQGNMKGVVFSSESAVTSTTLASMITEESAFIDMHLSPRYALPIENATALAFLKKICIALVVYRVTKVLNPKEVVPLPNNEGFQQISHASEYKEAVRLLKLINDGKMFLPFEDLASIPAFSSTAVNEDIQTELTTSEKQW